MLRITISKRLIVVATAILAVGVAILTYGTLQSGSAGNSQPADQTRSLEVELITLRPSGCEPSEITRPKNPFVLFIDDRSGQENSSLALYRINNEERLRAVNLNRKKSEWHDVIDLHPGTYVLQDANNSELRCQITVVP